MLELGPESLECVIDTLGLGLGEVSVSLDLALDVLELGFKLLLRLDSLHQHDVVVTIHLDQLVVHRRQRNVLVLLPNVACHVFLGELEFGIRDLGFHNRVTGGD